MKPEQLAEIREQEQLAAAKILGVRDVIFLRYPDQGLEDIPSFRKQMVQLIRQYRPEIVVTSDPYRRYIYHRDHRITGQVTLDAVFSYAQSYLAFPELLKEGFQPHHVNEILFWGSEEINYRSDITDTYNLKIAALRCHKSQIEQLDSPQREDWLKQRCRAMAEGEDFDLAEGFHREEIS